MNLFLENPKNIDAILQQKLSTKTYDIMELLHRSTHKDSKTCRFSILRFFYNLLQISKVLVDLHAFKKKKRKTLLHLEP